MSRYIYIICILFTASCNNSNNTNESENISPAPIGILAPVSIPFNITAIYPHDTSAYTQGLEIYNGKLYEGTGDYINSSIRIAEIKTGKLVPLGTTGSLRAKPLPDVPAIGEGGILKGYEMTIVYAVWAPTGLPSAVNNRLSKAIEQVVNSNAFREKLVGDGGEIMTIFSQSESQAYFQKELARLGKIVRDGNIRAD